VTKNLNRLGRADADAARLAESALDDLLPEGGLADLTQHDLQSYLWFALPENDEAPATAEALGRFFDLAEMGRYAAIAGSEQTRDILRTYTERGHAVGVRVATKAMDSSGVVPPDLLELQWGEVMGPAEMNAYDRVAATLELALAAGDLKPGGRGWRLTQARLTRTQLTMARNDGPPLLERVRGERLDPWATSGGSARRSLAASMLPMVIAPIAAPRDAAERMAPMQWLMELAAGRGGDPAGIPLTVSGNLARRVVQEAGERFNWWDMPDRPPRSESDMWALTVLRTTLQSCGALRRTGRRLVLGTRGRNLLDDPARQWDTAMSLLVDTDGFDGAAQEAALMLLLQAGGMVDMRELITEVADVVAGSGWRDTGNGAPPDERDVNRAVWMVVRRCQLWSMVDEGKGPGWSTRLRLTESAKPGGYAALRHLALRPRTDADGT
jgi:hypothetical protein